MWGGIKRDNFIHILATQENMTQFLFNVTSHEKDKDLLSCRPVLQ